MTVSVPLRLGPSFLHNPLSPCISCSHPPPPLPDAPPPLHCLQHLFQLDPLALATSLSILPLYELLGIDPKYTGEQLQQAPRQDQQSQQEPQRQPQQQAQQQQDKQGQRQQHGTSSDMINSSSGTVSSVLGTKEQPHWMGLGTTPTNAGVGPLPVPAAPVDGADDDDDDDLDELLGLSSTGVGRSGGVKRGLAASGARSSDFGSTGSLFGAGGGEGTLGAPKLPGGFPSPPPPQHRWQEEGQRGAIAVPSAAGRAGADDVLDELLGLSLGAGVRSGGSISKEQQSLESFLSEIG